MKRKIRVLALLLTTVMLFSLTASANSAMTYWNGTDASGAIITDENSPIVVEKENLIFDISSFPESSYEGETSFASYSASVTAEYTFYNSSDYTVTAKLLFPFGGIPQYGIHWDYNSKDLISQSILNLYGVRVDGQQIEANLRHSYSDYFDQFELEKDLARLVDGYLEDTFYSPELPVTKYTYRIFGISEDEEDMTTVLFLLNMDPDKTRVFLEQYSGMENLEEGIRVEANYRLGGWRHEGGRTFDLYVIGEPLETMPEWEAYSRRSEEGPKDSSFEILSTETMTFLEFTLLEREAYSEVSESDWYNAYVYLLNMTYTGRGLVGTELGTGIGESFMRWYEYEITLEPGERIVNTVTAPIYPAIDVDSSPNIYIYTYLLSPAKTWTEFGSLDIVINTPYYLLDGSLEGFEETESGYTLSMEGLPDGELKFTLSAAEHPELNAVSKRYAKQFVWYVIRDFTRYLLLPALVIIGIVVLLRMRKKKKDN